MCRDRGICRVMETRPYGDSISNKKLDGHQAFKSMTLL